MARGLSSCGTWALESPGPVVRRPSCSAACGILVPRPGIKPTSPALPGGFLTTAPIGKSLCLLLYLNLATPPCPFPFPPSELVPSFAAAAAAAAKLLQSCLTLRYGL